MDKCGWPYTTAVEENETLCTKLVRITVRIFNINLFVSQFRDVALQKVVRHLRSMLRNNVFAYIKPEPYQNSP